MRNRVITFLSIFITVLIAGCAKPDLTRPNIILVMTDDQGWGQTGYYNHPVLKTPNLDQMATNGLRFERFYAGAPNCSPTRATVLTGRSNDRTAVFNHGFPLRLQEVSIAQVLKQAGYATGHFGKWHLNGFTGPGAPILAQDPRNPGNFGFDEWLSVTNFYEMNPLMSRNGEFVELKGGSSEVIVKEALNFMENAQHRDVPFFAVIWYGSPHSPWSADAKDKESFLDLDERSQNHYGELVEMDRSIGRLRNQLRDWKISENTLIWFNSDNGGLSPFGKETVGGLRGWKGQMYEGGLRVPCIIEWPAGIRQSRTTEFPAVTMDIFPTLLDITEIVPSEGLHPIDGISLKDLLNKDLKSRPKSIPFRHAGRAALIRNDYKLVSVNIEKDTFELFNLITDPFEDEDIINLESEIAAELIGEFKDWNRSVEKSIKGLDYPEGLMESDPPRTSWMQSELYRPYLKEFGERPEFARWLKQE